MDNNLVSVVKGNDFILDLYVSKYDKDQGKQVPYDVSEATDVVLRLIGNNGFIKVIRDAQPNEFKITANVDGRLRDGKYGVELLFKINNMDKRIYQANKIEILNCNCCVDAGAQTTQVIPTYDLSMYMGVDVEKINFGAVTYGNIDSVLSETSTNPVMNKTVTAALKEAGKISDVLVNGESVVKDKVAEIITPTKVSELDNDADYLTEHQSLTDYAKISDVDASLDLKANKAYVEELETELEDKASKTFVASNYQPIGNYITTIPAEYVTETELEGKGYLTEHQSLKSYAKISDVDASLDLKADKTSIPTVPTKVSAFTNDAGYLTEHQSLSDYAKKTDIPVIPTKLSAFNNDEGFIKNTVTDLVNYYKKSETYTQDEVNELISKIPKFAIDVVDELPTSEISLTTVYLVKTSETADNMYTEYIYVNNAWEKLGEQKVDLTDYYTKNQIDNFLNEKADKTEIPDMKSYAKISDVDASLAKYTSTDSFNALNTEVLKKANKSYVDETFQVKGDYITEIPAEYVTETELEGKGYLTEHQSLTDYAKKTDIVTYKSGNGITIGADNTINALIGKGKGEGSLLGPYAASSTGLYNVSLGYQTEATGWTGDTALGYHTQASGSCSLAEGIDTTASGWVSHAEGNGTTASGRSSHAEGFSTKASGYYSHAEGYGTKASNDGEHASGQYNISNKASTVFGDAGNTLFSVGNGKDASTLHNAFEIRQNGDIYIADSSMGTPYKLQDKLNNFATKSEIPTIPSFKTINDEEITGTGNIEIKSYTAGEGINITDNVISSAFFKKGTAANSIQIIGTSHASGSYSLALGNGTKASGDYSHAEGNGTTASGSSSHAEGIGTTASGSSSHAEGNGTTASGWVSHAEGNGTTASGNYSHAEGSDTKALGDYSHAEGYGTKASGSSSHAEGSGTTASNSSEHASGQYNISNKASTVFGDAGNTLFSVGNGYVQEDDDTNRIYSHNAFEIRQNGDIYITDSFEGAPYKLQDKMDKIPSVKFWTGTQAEYDAIGTKDDNTVYFVK